VATQTSISGGIWHDLFYLYLSIALVVGGLVLGWLLYSLWRFRSRAGVPKPEDHPRAGHLSGERGHPIWTYVMAIVIAAIMFGLAFGTISAVHELETPPPEGEHLHVNITGFQFNWKVRYETPSGLPFARVGDWTMPIDVPVVANVSSQDVWHNFAIPDFRIRIDAVPGQVNHIWFQATALGEYHPVCVQLCGLGHATMRSTMRIVDAAGFDAYMAAEAQREHDAFAKAGKRVVDATFDGATLTATSTSKATGPVIVRVENDGQDAQAFALGPSHAVVSAGGVGFLYAPDMASAGQLVATGKASLDLGSVA
jgi:cytochrome c oxidase subunit 2